MRTPIRLGLAIAAAFGLSQPVLAEDATTIETKIYTDKKTISLDRSKAYLLIEGSGMIVSNWIVMPNEAQREDWERQRQEAFAKELKKYPGRLRNYERDLEVSKGSRGRIREPVKPVEPTEETFVWPELESQRILTVGPQQRLASEKGYSLWLYEVPATTITFYGLGMATMADCACLGTMSFDTQPGKVTAVRIAQSWLNESGEIVDRPLEGTSSTDVGVRIGLIVEPPSDYSLDPRIPRDMIALPQFKLVEGLPNWSGGTVNRVMPVPGLFTYERGKMVDLRKQ